MSIGQLARSLLRRAMTDPVGGTRLVIIRVVDEPAHVLVRLLGLLPDRARRAAVPVLDAVGRAGRRVLPRAGLPLLLHLAALDTAGRRQEAVALAREAGQHCSAVGRLTIAGWLAEIDRAGDGLALIAPLPDHHRVLRVRGRVRWRAGDWGMAREELAAAQVARPRPTTRRMLARVEDDLTAVSPGWLPDVPDAVVDRLRAAAPPSARGGRPVHLLNNSLPYVQTGYTVRAQRVALAQRTAGFDPSMVTKLGFPWRQGVDRAAERAEVDGVPYVHVPDPGGDTIFGTAARLSRAVERVGPTIADLQPGLLHPTSPFDNAQLALALRDHLDVPVVYELRGFLEETWLSRAGSSVAVVQAEASDRYQRTRATEGWCAAHADHVVTLGEAMKADLIERGVEPDRITVVPNAVDLDAFAPDRSGQRARRVRASLDVDPSQLLLGYISSLVPYEGVEVLLRATRELLDRGVDVRLVIVGEGTARTGWEREASELGLGARCRFTGRVPHAEVAAFYEAIDVFVVPRRDERVCRLVTPLKPVEAMALERCVVLSDLPALTEMVEEGVTGRTFPAEDPAGLADVVEELAADRELRCRLGATARERVAAERTWAANARRYAQVYTGLGLSPRAGGRR